MTAPRADGTARLPAILIAGGAPGTRRRLRDWARQEFPDCTALVADGAGDLREFLSDGQREILLVDIDGPGMQGIELLRLARSLAPQIAPIALSSYHADSYRDYALGAGAVACVPLLTLDGLLRQLVERLLRAESGDRTP